MSTEDRPKSEQTFEVGVTSAFAMMREDLDRTVKETHTYADKILDLLDQLEKVHLHKHARLQIIKEQSNTNKEKFDTLLSAYSSLLNDLVPWRTQVIQTGEEATQVQSVRMRESRKSVMNAAKRRLEESREKQQLATDAAELMKYYKALIMVT